VGGEEQSVEEDDKGKRLKRRPEEGMKVKKKMGIKRNLRKRSTGIFVSHWRQFVPCKSTVRSGRGSNRK
jgi:hypothetical protein